MASITQRGDTPSKTLGYALWIFRFTGSHRFYYGKSVTGTIRFFTLGPLGLSGPGHLYDYWTLNDQITVTNRARD
jgi:TM2 domain-containing membrane protein YozV